MPARSKSDLLDLTGTEYAKLRRLIDEISETYAMAKDEDDVSIKDVIGHRAHWIDLFLGWQADGAAGKDVAFPASGYKWSELKRYNADLRAAQADLDWDGARAELAAAFDRLERFLTAQSDAALYDAPMPGARNDWTTGRWAEAAGPSHFRSAAKYVRARLRALRCA